MKLQELIDCKLKDDESMNTISNLKVIRALDIDKLMLMEKENIIKYYE